MQHALNDVDVRLKEKLETNGNKHEEMHTAV